MGNLKEVRSPKGELLYYVEVEENETKKRRSKAKVKVKSKPKSNSEFLYVDIPPKTVKGKSGKLIYPKWFYDVQRRAYSEARSEGKEWIEANYRDRGMVALVEAWNAKMEEDGDVSTPPKV